MNQANEVVAQAKNTLLTSEKVVEQMIDSLSQMQMMFLSITVSIQEMGITVDAFLKAVEGKHPPEQAEILAFQLKEAERWWNNLIVKAADYPSNASLKTEIIERVAKGSKRKFI